MEIQLGATDESHIIRTLEYWDNERRRFPQYEHIAVIVAQEITCRFRNVNTLFNQAVPLIAIQMSTLDVEGVLTLYATRVLDLALPAPEEDDEPGQETDRNYLDHPWSRRRRPRAAPIQQVDRAPSPRRPAGDEPVHARPRSKHASGSAPPHDHAAGRATAFSLSSPLSQAKGKR